MRKRRGKHDPARGWAVDTAVDPGRGLAAWALVDGDGSHRAHGWAQLVRRPQPDSTGAEADGIRQALDHVRPGEVLLTDAAFVVREVGRAGRRHAVSGRVGEIEDALARAQVRLKAVSRSHPGVRAAHRAARTALREGDLAS